MFFDRATPFVAEIDLGQVVERDVTKMVAIPIDLRLQAGPAHSVEGGGVDIILFEVGHDARADFRITSPSG